MYLIETKGLTKRYGKVNVVDHVDMHIPENSIYGFVGENGSGKTTIMRLLTGLAEPTAGSFTLFGIPNTDKRIYEARQKVAAIVETASLIPSFTAKDNMRYQELYLGLKMTDEERMTLLKQVHLEDVGTKLAQGFHQLGATGGSIHLVALLGQHPCRVEADATAGTGNQYHLL